MCHIAGQAVWIITEDSANPAAGSHISEFVEARTRQKCAAYLILDFLDDHVALLEDALEVARDPAKLDALADALGPAAVDRVSLDASDFDAVDRLAVPPGR